VSGVNRSGAIKKTRIAQVAGLALVALTAGAVMYNPGLPEPKNEQAGDPFGDDPSAENTNQSQTGDSYSIDPSESYHIGGILNKIAGLEKTIVITPTGKNDVDNPPPETPTADGWRYLGGVFEPNISFALVEIDGKQRMLKEGMKLPEYDAEVLSVEEGRIEITRNGVREKITLTAASGALVSVSDPAEGGARASSIIAPGMQTEFDIVSSRQHQIIGTDADKRRAEFERRKLERENRLVGIER